MSRFVVINLADVPPPAIIETLDAETIIAQIVADTSARMNAAGIPYDVSMLENDPFVYLAEAFAARELNLRARINDTVKAVMLSSSWGSNLDNVGAPFDTARVTINSNPGAAASGTFTFTAQPNNGEGVTIGTTTLLFAVSPANALQVQIGTSLALSFANLLAVLQGSKDLNLITFNYALAGYVLTVTAVAPSAAGNSATLASSVNGSTVSGATLSGGVDPSPGAPENDDSYRSRIQLAPEAFSSAGPEGGYIYYALQVLGPLGAVDATAVMTRPGYVLVTVMMGNGVFQPSSDQILALYNFFAQEDAKPLTDIVSVAGPKVIPVTITAVLTLYPGPDANVVKTASINVLNALLASEQKLGRSLTRSAIIAALQQNAVLSVNLLAPAADVTIDDTQVFNVTTIDVSTATLRAS
jgi:phage-related baseplate assembly protein